MLQSQSVVEISKYVKWVYKVLELHKGSYMLMLYRPSSPVDQETQEISFPSTLISTSREKILRTSAKMLEAEALQGVELVVDSPSLNVSD
ncbi:hypothetical protein WN943_002906 [Citrus x changshan-huyou]